VGTAPNGLEHGATCPSLTGMPQRDAPRPTQGDQVSRRALVGGGLGMAGLAASALALPGPAAAGSARGPGRVRAAAPARRDPAVPRIAVVGAGLAGLTCAYELAKHGLPATVYEANPHRLGGRCWTSRGWADGQTAEHGGEFIDSVHRSIRQLVAEVGLELDDLSHLPGGRPRPRDRYFLDGARRGASEVYHGYHRLRQVADRDARRIGSFAYDRAGRAAHELDEQTAAEWLHAAVGETHPLLVAETAQYMAEEYGLDPRHLSALNMVLEFAGGGLPSDERFHVRGGNDQVVSRVVARLPEGTVVQDARLTSLRRRADGRYRLGFHSAPAQWADVVVLAAPFAALRQADLGGAGLSRRKLDCIEHLGMGTNAKVMIQLDRHVTRYGRPGRSRWSGEYYGRRVDTWASTLAEPGRSSVLTVYSGGRAGASYDVASAHGPAPDHVVAHTLARIAHGVPHLAAGYAGRAWVDAWVDDPYTHGSYAAFRPGQFTRWWGFVGKPEHHVHVAGEHTSRRALGFLEGAVSTGQRAAREVRASLSRDSLW
jgi:monoamine oxidase